LGTCLGERPWLLDRDPNGCDQKLKLLTRTATNTYFPQIYTVISLPIEAARRGDLRRAIQRTSVQDVAGAKRFNSKVAATLGPYSDEEIYARLLRIRAGATASTKQSPKLSEFEAFASGRPEIGQNLPGAKLYARTLPRSAWANPESDFDLSAIKKCHRRTSTT
jgi:hypothetical protein